MLGSRATNKAEDEPPKELDGLTTSVPSAGLHRQPWGLSFSSAVTELKTSSSQLERLKTCQGCWRQSVHPYDITLFSAHTLLLNVCSSLEYSPAYASHAPPDFCIGRRLKQVARWVCGAPYQQLCHMSCCVQVQKSATRAGPRFTIRMPRLGK